MIAREIGLIRDKWLAKIVAMKIKAYQDQTKSRDQLTWLEFLNIKCNEHLKELIRNEAIDIVPFSFELQSPYVTSILNYLTLNMKDSILVTISLSQAKEYLQKKL